MEKSTTNQQFKQAAQLDSAIALLMEPKHAAESIETAQTLQNVFDLLLWAQKKSHKVLQTALELDFLTHLLSTYPNPIQPLLSGMILIFGNARQEGPLVSHLLQKRLGDRIITLYLQQLSDQSGLQQQQLHVLGGLLRVYHRHFSPASYHLYLNHGRCLLIDLCCRFFNCPEEITRTSVMNILMSILKAPFISQLTAVERIREDLGRWCTAMCRLFRNELKDFDRQLQATDQKESEFIIHSINDKIILWEDLSSLNAQLFAPLFYSELLVPLIVGALNTTAVPLFTLKFSLVLVNKLIPTISKLNLLNQLGSLLFEDKEILYTGEQLGTAILPPFSLKTLLCENSQQSQQTESPNVFKHLPQSFLNILRSKDGRFLQCLCVLLVSLLWAVKKQPSAIEFYVKKLGFGMGGVMAVQLSQAMITQFTAVHTLEITRVIAASLVYIQPVKYLDQELTRRLVHVFKSNVQEALLSLQKQKQIHAALAEILEYDVRIIQSKQFSLEPVMKTDAALLFNNHFIENETLPFYQQLPETALHVARYQIVKSLFLRNVVKRLVEECSNDNSIERYIEKQRQIDSKYIKSGQNIKLPLSVNSYRCKLQDSKVTIPNCLILDDDYHFILGFCQNSTIRVISNFKYKHLHTELNSKKDYLFMEVATARYNPSSQLMEYHKEFVLRQVDVGEEYFRGKKAKLVAQEIGWLCELLRNAKANLPEFSLL